MQPPPRQPGEADAVTLARIEQKLTDLDQNLAKELPEISEQAHHADERLGEVEKGLAFLKGGIAIIVVAIPLITVVAQKLS